MAKKVITMSLDPASIDAAIKQIEEYKKDMLEKLDRLRRLVAITIQFSAQNGFSTGLVSDVFKGGAPPDSNVSVTVNHNGGENGEISVVIANGNDAVFMEFGAGVLYNGAAGTSPHPLIAQNPTFTIGSYGKGYGRRRVWALPKEMWTEQGENGKLVPMLTHGTPASMPMYKGEQEAVAQLASLVKEVFG